MSIKPKKKVIKQDTQRNNSKTRTLVHANKYFIIIEPH